MMNRDYKISNDGTIFEIKEDGSIYKIAKIDGQRNITDLSGNIMSVNVCDSNNTNTGVYWFFILVFVITTIILGVLYSEVKKNYNLAISESNEYKEMYENTISLYNVEISSLKKERDAAKSELSNIKNKVSSAYPLIITDIQIANIYDSGTIETDYGNTIYSSYTMYLKPKIKYNGIVSGYYNLKVKWYKPDGTISVGSSSPTGFSQSENVYIYTGYNEVALSGWGSKFLGHWSKGKHRIEIWYENSCLKSEVFTIY